MARTCALITPVQAVLHRVSCSNETLPNAPKQYETHQNMNLGSNGVDRVRSLRKIRMRLRGTNFCFNGTRSSPFVSSFVQVMKNPKWTQTLWNTPKYEYSVQWGGSGAFVAKNTTLIRGTNFCMNWTSLVCFATSFMQLRNDPKCTQILRNGPKH